MQTLEGIAVSRTTPKSSYWQAACWLRSCWSPTTCQLTARRAAS